MLVLAGCARPAGGASALQAGSAPGQLRLSVIDVGQGDSILAQLPNGQNMLVDGGPLTEGRAVAVYLKSCGVNRIDYLVATHPHEDHVGGLLGVLPAFPVGRIYMPGATTGTITFERLLQQIKNRGLTITTARAGVGLFHSGSLQAVFLAPCGTKYDDLNNWSAVIRLQYGKEAFLLTADAQAQSEREMLDSGADLKADVLKIGHHGSVGSTTAAFLKAVAPRYAVISAGAGNDYGHPRQAILDKLQQAGIQIYRTDRDGTVVFTTDGSKIRVDCLPRPSRDTRFSGSGSIGAPVNWAGEILGFLEELRARLLGR